MNVKEYFALQYRIINRRLKDAGLEPVLGYIIFSIGFIVLSICLFSRTEYAKYIYLILALIAPGNLTDQRRNEFLTLCFGEKKMRKIRIAENLVVTSPYLAFLCFKQLFLFALLSGLLSVLSAFRNSDRTSSSSALPTPFSKRPFEFTVGFRNTLLLLLGAYALTVIALVVDNFNLGIFSLLLVLAVIVSYYILPEDEYYVWIHQQRPPRFLWNKTKMALAFSFILCLPAVILLAVFYPGHIGITLTFYLLGCAFLITIILAKYAGYPEGATLIQWIPIILSIIFPFLLLVIAPWFYYISLKRLNHLLV